MPWLSKPGGNMNHWKGKSAIVTGAGSGIGLALSEAMLARGAQVWLTDINAKSVAEAAERLGEGAHWLYLDVRDVGAVQACVDQVVEQHGTLDYLFNNAGIGVGGRSEDLSEAHYDRIIDVNIRGVINGVLAAYPQMIKQGHGHIISTASMAGLTPSPLLSAYAMTKHAVVGLSTSLRLEAERHGVRVTALCPAVIETPLIDSMGPEDLPLSWKPDSRRFLTSISGTPYPVARLAEDALRGVERNRNIIISPTKGYIGMLIFRLFPFAFRRLMRRAIREALENHPDS